MAFQPYCPVDCDPGETLEGSHGLSEWRRPPTMARGPVTAEIQNYFSLFCLFAICFCCLLLLGFFSCCMLLVLVVRFGFGLFGLFNFGSGSVFILCVVLIGIWAEVYPIWLCPHRLFKLPIKTMVYPEPGFKHHCRQGDTSYARMFTGMGPVLRGEVFDGAEAVSKMEQWLIENHSFQQQYAVSELK
ncbi:hypothetical protein Godav_013847 [Gossypium davidsonii]|uniref:Uncharacterized protein n=1 Tax=Gossypium davidsonii TaxID=34287 RepID=A0A7J8RHT7_GOSDV|nr:hypothetical protein [Gossypium davidsonii]